MRAYAGAVGLVESGEAKTTATILCEEKVTGEFTNPKALVPDGTVSPVCAAGQSTVTK
jgi:hypothetical protein